jgi:hypothetical protein
MLTDALAPTGAFGPPPGALTAGLAAWPAHDGTTFYGYDGTQNITWVRRGSGRWWRFQADGNPLSLLVPLTATRALAWKLPTPQNGIPTALAVVDLTHPSVTPPTVQIGPGELTCAVPWPASDADISAYAWLRDGSPVPGADGATFAPRPADRGHDLTCRATARTDFGATSVTAGNSYRDPPGANAFRVRLTGQPRYGATLRCSIAPRVTWLRGGKAVRDRHERSYRVGAADEGRTLACRATVDGIVVRSAAVRIPPPHGGRATLARVSP